MKVYINIIAILFLVSCKAQDKEQTNHLAYCSDAIFINNLQINTVCNKKSPEAYSIEEIKQAFNIPLMREVNKPVDENTGGGNETYQMFLFEEPQKGHVTFKLYDKKIPEAYITHPDVTVKLGQYTFKVGDDLSKLKNVLNAKGFNNDEGKELFIYFDFNVLAFGIKDSKIEYIAFSGNYFF